MKPGNEWEYQHSGYNPGKAGLFSIKILTRSDLPDGIQLEVREIDSGNVGPSFYKIDTSYTVVFANGHFNISHRFYNGGAKTILGWVWDIPNPDSQPPPPMNYGYRSSSFSAAYDGESLLLRKWMGGEGFGLVDTGFYLERWGVLFRGRSFQGGTSYYEDKFSLFRFNGKPFDAERLETIGPLSVNPKRRFPIGPRKNGFMFPIKYRMLGKWYAIDGRLLP